MTNLGQVHLRNLMARVNTAKHACSSDIFPPPHTLMQKFKIRKYGNNVKDDLVNHTYSKREHRWKCLACYKIHFIFKKKEKKMDVETILQQV